MKRQHRMPFGAEVLGDGHARFRLWAPAAERLFLCIESGRTRELEMERRAGGWHELEVEEAPPGTLYRFRLPDGLRVPDPASRFQPQDVHGPSELIDPGTYHWSDDGWEGRRWEETVLYELHVGAFTGTGTYAGVEEKLEHLVALGVTAIELMPLSDAPGRHNWGYDGVYPFAPEAAYGRPDELKALIEQAQRRGLMVFLDVVYNHFGPEGNYLHAYAPDFFTERHHTPWGAGINVDGRVREPREFFIHNALYWIEEYRLDGLRLDAVHAILDDSAPDLLTELAQRVQEAAEGRRVHLVLENDDNASRYLERHGTGAPRHYAAQWNDDLHHALHVLLTGEEAAYYADYADRPIRHLGRALTEGFAYQGEPSPHRDGRPRGEPSAHLPALAFVNFLQNHDQVGNRAFGERIALLAAPEAVRAATAVVLLAPSPPLLFMGEEWGSRQPFPFFCDFGDDLADAVREGRRREFARFPAFRDEAARARIPDPNAESTYATAVLDWNETGGEAGRSRLAFVSGLLALRHAEIVPRLSGLPGDGGCFETHGQRALSAPWRLGSGERLWLYANLGPEPLGDAPERPHDARLLVAIGEGMEEGLQHRLWPPWSVAWLLAPDGGGTAS